MDMMSYLKVGSSSMLDATPLMVVLPQTHQPLFQEQRLPRPLLPPLPPPLLLLMTHKMRRS